MIKTRLLKLKNYLKESFNKFEKSLENFFCDPNDCYSMNGAGGRMNGKTDEERNLDTSEIPTFKDLFKK